MAKYRKKPIVIEAIKWNGKNFKEIEEFCNNIRILRWIDMALEIQTLEGKIIATQNDYIIKGIKGEFYPCKPDIFEATYEEVL